MKHIKVSSPELGALSGTFKDVNAAFDSNAVSTLVKDTIGKSSGSLTLASASIDGGFAGVAECCSRAMNFIKYDIFMK